MTEAGRFNAGGAARTGRSAARSSVRMFLGEALVVPTGLIVVAYLARELGPSGYGLFTLTATMVLYVEFVVSAFFSQPLVRLISSTDDPRPVIAAATRLRLVVDISAVALVWLAAPAVAGALDEPGMFPILRLFAFDIPLYGLARTRRDSLIGLRLFDRAALAAALRWISRLVLIVLLVELGWSITGAVVASIGASAIEALAARSGIRISYLARTGFPLRRLLGYAIPLFISYVSLLLFARTDLFMLKLLGIGTLGVGIYAAAQNVALTIRLVGRALSPVVLALLSSVRAAGDMDAGRSAVVNGFRAIFALAPLVALVSASASEITRLLFGPGYVGASVALAILAPAAYALVIVSVGWAMLIAAGRPRLVLCLAVPLTGLAVLGNVLAVPRFGIAGAATVTLAVSWSCAIATTGAVCWVWAARPSLRTVLRSALTGCAVTVIAILWPAPGLLILVKLTILSTAAVALLVALGELSAGELCEAFALLGRDDGAPDDSVSIRNRS